MCCQIFLYACRHMKRIRLPCRRVLRRKTSFFGPLKECFSPTEPCNRLINGLERLGRACRECTPKQREEWPLWDKDWCYHGMSLLDDNVDVETHWSGREFVQQTPLTPQVATPQTSEPERCLQAANISNVGGPKRMRRWSCETLDTRKHGEMVSGDCPQHSKELLYQYSQDERFRSIYRVPARDDLHNEFKRALSDLSDLSDQSMIDEIMENRILIDPDIRSLIVSNKGKHVETKPYSVPEYACLRKPAEPFHSSKWDVYGANDFGSLATRRGIGVF